MSNPDLSLRHKRIRWAFTTLCYVLVASLLGGCPSAENPAPTANNPKPGTTNEYSIGDKINFAENGNSKPFKVSGWSEAERTHSWTDGPVSVLDLRVPPTTKPLTLNIKCAGFTKNPEIPSQPVEVFVNDEKISDWNVLELAAEYSAPIPPAISKSGGILTITLKIPKAVSPKSLGTSQDPRLLGLACIEASLTPTQ